MFKSPYDTTAIPPYDLRGLIKSVETAKVEGHLVSGLVADAPNVLSIISDADVPVLVHPISFTSVLDKQLYTVVDIRSYSSQLRRISEQNVEIPNSGPIPFNMMRARLQQLWNLPTPPDMFNVSTLPQNLFSLWVSDRVADALRLDIETALSIRVFAALWYMCLFEEGAQKVVSESEMVSYASTINRSTKIPIERILTTLGLFGKTVTNSQEFVAALKTIGAIRLQKMSVGVLYTTMATSWFGSTSVREVVGVALEYPPTFIAMIWSGVHERTYRNTPIGQLLQRFGRDGVAQDFSNSLGLMLKDNEG